MVYERNRQTELQIDLEAMEYNYNQIRKMHPDKEILPVLKASGYGIGAKNVKKFLDKMRLERVATAFVDEGVVLRAGLDYKGEIITLNQPSQGDIDNILEHDIVVGVCSLEFIKELNDKAKRKGKNATIHIEIETGMGRTGVLLNELSDFLQELKKLGNIKTDGVYTHFATSDSDIEFTYKQIENFNKAVEEIEKELGKIKYIHTSNSAAIIRLSKVTGNMLRPGIMLYGYYPSNELKENIKLKPCCVLKSKISFIKSVEEGTSISYGRTYITKRKSVIANVPIGYADGIRRNLSNKGCVVIHGKKAPIVGTICMDSFMIDVTDIPNVKIEDDVYIWDNDLITLDEVAKNCDTISYEILSTISNRVIRKCI